MNDEEFEDKLRALTAKLVRPDPTPGWKSDILARSRATCEKGAPRPPRWFLTMLGAAWLLIAFLRFTTPADIVSPNANAISAELGSAEDVPLRTLMAFRANPELLDLP